MKIKKYLDEYRSEITPILGKYFQGKREEVERIDPSVVELVEHFIDIAPRGKMVRGILTVLGYRLAGGRDSDKILRVSAGVEILEAGILIQDDFMDRDDMRRGVKSVRARYEDQHLGNVMATLAGDMAFGWALELIYSSGFDANLLLRAVARYNELFYGTVYGQILDIYTANVGQASREQIEKINAYKTAQYTFVLPLSVGAILAGASEDDVEKLAQFGMMGGIVFQLRDDWLSVFGESEKMGKVVGNDLREGKENAVADIARARMGDEFDKLRSDHEESGLEKLIEKMRKNGVDREVQSEIEKRIEECLAYLATLNGESETKDYLSEMVQFVGRRDK